MSEIFEALLKAQREAEGRSGAPAQTANPAAVTSAHGSNRHGEQPAGEWETTGTRRRWVLRWLPDFRWVHWMGNGDHQHGRNGHHRDGLGHGTPWLIGPDHQSAVAEQFRMLRTHIETLGPGTLMITSALDREGKSLCAINLAAALAMGIGSGVILIDADLRRPGLGAHFGSHGHAGLLNCLTGQARWKDCLISTTYDGLRVLPAGGHSAIAAELLGSEQMRVIIAQIRSEFPQHRILFDTPPILLTADPLVVARYMDHLLLVVRAGITPRRAVTQAIATLGADRFVGVVLNDATDNLSDYYYYGGRYSYNGTTPAAKE